MDVMVKVGQFLLSLSILVLLHELGHFLFARLFGVRVEKFYIFFNPYFSLYKRQIGQTEFGVGWLPLGGYVKLGGMIDESLDTEQMKAAPRSDDFRVKPGWQRLLIMLGGVLMNLLLAWVIYSCVLLYQGRSYLACRDVTWGVAAEPLGRELGFEDGDRVVAVNGEYLEDFSRVYTQTALTPDSRVTVERDGERVDVVVPKHYLSRLVQGEPLFSLRMPMVVEWVAPESAAARAGFQAGDSLVGLGGVGATFFDEFRGYVRSHADETVQVSVVRAGGGDPVDLNVSVPASGVVGVRVVGDASRFFQISRHDYGFFEAIGAGATLGWRTLATYTKSLALLFVPEAEAYKSLGGFISIGNIFPGSWNWLAFWNMTAFLSLILAVMNILPIPGLDGGHVMFLLYEMITGRRPSEAFMVRAQVVGMLFLLLLVVFANLNDIIRLFR